MFVAGDLFWYPVEGAPGNRFAPDALVAFGRPKGHRGSYRQWEEGGVAAAGRLRGALPQQPLRRDVRKFEFYRRYGVEEYYLYDPDPDRLELSGFLRRGRPGRVRPMHGHVSPRLGIRFEMGQDGLRLLRPDGQPFATYKELARQRKQERRRAPNRARAREQERERADRLQAELDRLRRAAGSEGPAAT